METILIASALSLITFGFSWLGAIELDNYEKTNGKAYRFDLPLMLLICFSPLFVFLATYNVL